MAKFDLKKLEKAIQQKAADALNDRAYSISCPHCHANVSVKPGIGLCPVCGKEIDLKLNVTYK